MDFSEPEVFIMKMLVMQVMGTSWTQDFVFANGGEED